MLGEPSYLIGKRCRPDRFLESGFRNRADDTGVLLYLKKPMYSQVLL